MLTMLPRSFDMHNVLTCGNGFTCIKGFATANRQNNIRFASKNLLAQLLHSAFRTLAAVPFNNRRLQPRLRQTGADFF